MTDVVLTTDIPGLKLFKRGKVRDIYDTGEALLIIATDRISAFDVVMPNGIPDKGRVLTALSCFWFNLTGNIIDNHLITSDADEIISRRPELKKHKPMLDGRSMLTKKAETLPVECVVRGYLAGSGWKEYKENGSICGIKLPGGLKESSRLPFPIFTPSTKAETGHDENITEEKAAGIVGNSVFKEIKEKSLALYQRASGYAETKGIIISDTKFEFGKYNGNIILIDEILTPDSSRFWPRDEYKPGMPQKSFDKQFVRDYLEGIKWDKRPPAPRLPDEIVQKTREKYNQALRLLAE